MGNLASRIEEARAKLRISTAELCRRAGLSRGHFYKIRNGEVSPELHTLESLAQALEVDRGWLATGTATVGGSTEPPAEAQQLAMRPLELAQRLLKLEERVRSLEGADSKPAKRRGATVPLRVVEPPSEEDETVEVFYDVDLAAGEWLPADELGADMVQVPARLVHGNRGQHRVAGVRGTSMTRAGIPDGSLVLCRAAPVRGYHNGDVVVVRIEGPAGGEGTIKRYHGTRLIDGVRCRVLEAESDNPDDHELTPPRKLSTVVAVVVAVQRNGEWYEVPRTR